MKRKALIAFGLAAALSLSPAAALRTVAEGDILTSDTPGQEVQSDILPAPSEKSLFPGPGGVNVRVYAAATPKTALYQGTLAPWEGDPSRLGLTQPPAPGSGGKTEVSVVLSVTEATRILHAVTGEPLALADIRPDEQCYVYTDAVMLMSYPAQTGAQVILAKLPADFSVPSYVEVDTVRQNEKGDTILGTDQAMNITLTDSTEVFPYLTRNIVTREAILPGHRLLVWHGAIAESYPSQTTASKVMVFPYAYAGHVSLEGDALRINGEAIAFTATAKMKVEGETCLLPLRLVLEQLGYEVIWTAADESVRVRYQGETLYTLTLGAETLQADGREQYLTRPVQEEKGVSYMALDDFLQLHQLKMETQF